MYQIYQRLRDERNLKDFHVSQKAKISPSSFTRWRKGEFHPKYETMLKIASALEVPVSVFYEGQDDQRV